MELPACIMLCAVCKPPVAKASTISLATVLPLCSPISTQQYGTGSHAQTKPTVCSTPSLPVQPNPNSIIQNDEARGTNHLDFFRFVGRVVGKVSPVLATPR